MAIRDPRLTLVLAALSLVEFLPVPLATSSVYPSPALDLLRRTREVETVLDLGLPE